MSHETKFKIGDRILNTEDRRTGSVIGGDLSAWANVVFDGYDDVLPWTRVVAAENLAHLRRITSVDQIRTGATYDMAGAHLIGQGDDEDHYASLRDSAGDVALNHIELTRLFELGAVITEIAPPPDPDWQPGDWIEDAKDRLFFYVPNGPEDPAPFRPMYPKDEDEYDFFPRAGMKGPLKLHYRHEAAS